MEDLEGVKEFYSLTVVTLCKSALEATKKEHIHTSRRVIEETAMNTVK